jgi:hypothetical protein
MASGLSSTICTGLPASTANQRTSKLSFSGKVWMRTTRTPSARKSRRIARPVSGGSLTLKRSPN